MRVLFLLVFLAASAAAQSFEFDAATARVPVWGRGLELSRFYFDEWLPALFERKVEIDRADLQGGALEWIFTGDRGGFTAHVEAGGARLAQRYYDSFGFHSPEALKEKTPRHPERDWQESGGAYEGALKSVEVALDHRFQLVLRVNGKEIARQLCLLDVRRHQLRFVGQQGVLRGHLGAAHAIETLVKVDPARRHQTMLGFGGITTPVAYAQLSAEGKQRWWRYLREYNLLLQREYPNGNRLHPAMDNWDRLADATPHYYGDNFPNGEISDFAYLSQLTRLGGKTLFEFWDPPRWARDEHNVVRPEAWARAMLDYCRKFQARTGAPPAILGIQNEKHQPAGVWHEMALTLRRELDRAGFQQVKIHMQDAAFAREGIRSAGAFRESPRAWAAIDYSAAHMYDYQQHFTDPDAFDATLLELHRAVDGKPFLSTEICVNSSPWQFAGYRLALSVGELYHKNLTLMDAAALLYCWLLLDVEQPSYGATRSLFVPDPAQGFVPVPSSHQLRVLGAYSRHIREGMVRVEAISADPDLLVTAFESARGARTLVLLNRGLARRRVRVEWPGERWRVVEITDQYRQNEPRPAPATGAIEVEPGAIVTLSTAARERRPL